LPRDIGADVFGFLQAGRPAVGSPSAVALTSWAAFENCSPPGGWASQRRASAAMVTHYSKKRREVTTMAEPKLEVPTELRELAEKTIEQAEKAFGMFFDAASKSISTVPGAGSDISKQALTFTEQNMRAAFEHARKLVHATDFQEAMRIQSEFLRSQFTNAGEHMRQITGQVMSATKDASKGKF
jgi:phasin